MIKLGLYGAGARTKTLLDALIQDRFYCVHAVYDLVPQASKALTEQYGGKVCNTADDLICDPEINAFLISLSPFAHAEALRKVIPCGKPVFVEKPVSFSAQEVRELAELAEQYQVPVQVGFMRRYLPQTLEVLKFIRENEPGKLLSVDCNWFHHGDTEMNYYLQHSPDDFRLQVSQIPFHCCHMLDIMLLVGGKFKRVNSVMQKVFASPYPSPDDLIANIEFENGATGRFHYSSMVYYGEISYRFHFENYSIKLDCSQNQIEIFRRPKFRTTQLGPDPVGTIDFGKFNASYERACFPQTINFQNLASVNENIMYDFVQMIRDKHIPSADLRTAQHVQELAEAIERSGKEKRSITPADLY